MLSCTRTIYNLEYSSKKPKCDTSRGQINLRIINAGKFGISSLKIYTDSGEVKYPGIKPNDTTCYFKIPPIYNNPTFEISIVRFNNIGMSGAGAILHFIVDRSKTQEKLNPGNYTMRVLLKKVKRKLTIGESTIIAD